jgi:CCR4-NOT transcription complex subunit 6
VALIAVLEALDPPFADGNTGGQNGQTASRRQLVCVANTHIHSNPELGDVKLWQVHTLLKGLEKIAASADIPMLVAGDFNATPSSAAHSLLVKGSVPPTSLELLNDPLGILKPVGKLAHRLPLASAYATVAAASDMDQAAQRQRRRLDPLTGEPTFTNITRDFKGTLDYVLYSRDSLVPCAALELPDESEVRSRGIPGLPNDLWSSDHVALMVEFQYRAPAGTPVSLLQPTSPTTP